MRVLLIILLALAGFPAWAANTYVDHTKTGGGNTGADTTNAWLSIETAVEAAHSAGDTIKVRATHAETLGGQVDPANDGTASNPIVVWADDGTAWSSSPAGTPTITHGANKFYFVQDDYWLIHGLHHTGASLYCYELVYTNGTQIEHCTFSGFLATADIGIYARSGGLLTLDQCVFDGNTVGSDGNKYGIGIQSAAMIHLSDCTFDGMSRAIALYGGEVYAHQCDFEQTEVNTDNVYSDVTAGFCYLFGGSMGTNNYGSAGHALASGGISRYYRDGSHRPTFYRYTDHYKLAGDYATAHSGGADYSIKLSGATADIGTINPVKICEYAVHADSAEVRDYTISAYRDAAWGAAPTAAQLYVEVAYQHADSLKREVSTAVLTNVTTWYDLTVSSITPNHDGPVMVTLWLKTYDTDGAIYVDPRLVATGEEYRETFLWGGPDLAFFYTAPAAGGQIIIISGG